MRQRRRHGERDRDIDRDIYRDKELEIGTEIQNEKKGRGIEGTEIDMTLLCGRAQPS